LIEKKVEYLVVGGHSVIANGYIRSTNDLDIWFRPEINNVNLILDCLRDFGLGALNITSDHLLLKGKIVQLGVAPVRIDLVNEIDGVEFDECYANRFIKEVYGMKVNFLNHDDLIKNKRASGRNKDLNDIENLP